MRFADPYAIRRQEPRETIIFAASQDRGDPEVQEDYFLNFNDECFVLADGTSSRVYGEVAARLACTTAIWAYKHIRQHRYYWLDKKLFMKRIFRSTNMAVWQKRRERGFEEGPATTLMVLMVGAKTYWLGHAGDSSAWLVRSGITQKLTPEAEVLPESHNASLGIKRFGLLPVYATGQLKTNDAVIMATDGCANFLTPTDILASVASVGSTAQTAAAAATSLLTAARANGSRENMTTVILKRVDTHAG